MRILPPFEEKIRHSIRDELAKKPTITMTALKEQLEKEYGRDFHFSYLRKLVGKVRNEINFEIDRAQIEPRLAFTRDGECGTRAPFPTARIKEQSQCHRCQRIEFELVARIYEYLAAAVARNAIFS
jgi:hypothetical protein